MGIGLDAGGAVWSGVLKGMLHISGARGDTLLWIENSGDPTPYMTVISGGNVGIGVADPLHKLHVAGDTFLSGYLYDSTHSTGSDGLVLTSKNGGPQWKMIEDVLSGVGGSGAQN